MKHKPDRIININVNWRILIVFGVILCILLGAYSISWAQNNNTPDINDSAVSNDNSGQQNANDLSPVPEIQCGDGLIPTTNGECISMSELETLSDKIGEGDRATISGAGQGHFYVTFANYATDHVLTACAAGYHAASLWEMLDISNMVYDNSHPAAFNRADSGKGPPSYWYGWARTGYDSSGSSVTGTGNCLNWTSTSDSYYGVAVRLSNTWELAPGDISTWDANSFPCNYTGPVWCVGD